ncbi:MAG: S8/S53 family peptidase, partial [archaeon]
GTINVNTDKGTYIVGEQVKLTGDRSLGGDSFSEGGEIIEDNSRKSIFDIFGFVIKLIGGAIFDIPGGEEDIPQEEPEEELGIQIPPVLGRALVPVLESEIEREEGYAGTIVILNSLPIDEYEEELRSGGLDNENEIQLKLAEHANVIAAEHEIIKQTFPDQFVDEMDYFMNAVFTDISLDECHKLEQEGIVFGCIGDGINEANLMDTVEQTGVKSVWDISPHGYPEMKLEGEGTKIIIMDTGISPYETSVKNSDTGEDKVLWSDQHCFCKEPIFWGPTFGFNGPCCGFEEGRHNSRIYNSLQWNFAARDFKIDNWKETQDERYWFWVGDVDLIAGHGTKMAVTVGGKGVLDEKTGITLGKGIAPKAKLAPLRIANNQDDSTYSYDSDIIRGLSRIKYDIKKGGTYENPDVILLAWSQINPQLGIKNCYDFWGGLIRTGACYQLEKFIKETEKTVVVSAGNNGPEQDSIAGFSLTPSAITVGESTKDKECYSIINALHCEFIQNPEECNSCPACVWEDFSCVQDPNWGRLRKYTDYTCEEVFKYFGSAGCENCANAGCALDEKQETITRHSSRGNFLLNEKPDLVAPVRSQVWKGETSREIGVKIPFPLTGTSFAAAHVAGVVALMQQKAKALRIELTPEDIKDILTETAKNLWPHSSIEQGHGRVDALAAVNTVTYNWVGAKYPTGFLPDFNTGPNNFLMPNIVKRTGLCYDLKDNDGDGLVDKAQYGDGSTANFEGVAPDGEYGSDTGCEQEYILRGSNIGKDRTELEINRDRRFTFVCGDRMCEGFENQDNCCVDCPSYNWPPNPGCTPFHYYIEGIDSPAAELEALVYPNSETRNGNARYVKLVKIPISGTFKHLKDSAGELIRNALFFGTARSGETQVHENGWNDLTSYEIVAHWYDESGIERSKPIRDGRFAFNDHIIADEGINPAELRDGEYWFDLNVYGRNPNEIVASDTSGRIIIENNWLDNSGQKITAKIGDRIDISGGVVGDFILVWGKGETIGEVDNWFNQGITQNQLVNGYLDGNLGELNTINEMIQGPGAGTYIIRLIKPEGTEKINEDYFKVELEEPNSIMTPQFWSNYVAGEGRTMNIKGESGGREFESYEIQWAKGIPDYPGGEDHGPLQWFDAGITLPNNGRNPVEGPMGNLGTLDLSRLTEDGEYTLRITTHYRKRTSVKYRPFLIKNIRSALYNNDPSAELTGYFKMYLQKYDNGLRNWITVNEVIDDLETQTERRVPGKMMYIFNSLWDEQNVRVNENGRYRVYVAFVNERGQIIRTQDESLISYSYFDVQNSGGGLIGNIIKDIPRTENPNIFEELATFFRKLF